LAHTNGVGASPTADTVLDKIDADRGKLELSVDIFGS
jgi:hypothetical protein